MHPSQVSLRSSPEGRVLQCNIPLYSKDLGVRLAIVAFSRSIYSTR